MSAFDGGMIGLAYVVVGLLTMVLWDYWYDINDDPGIVLCVFVFWPAMWLMLGCVGWATTMRNLLKWTTGKMKKW